MFASSNRTDVINCPVGEAWDTQVAPPLVVRNIISPTTTPTESLTKSPSTGETADPVDIDVQVNPPSVVLSTTPAALFPIAYPTAVDGKRMLHKLFAPPACRSTQVEPPFVVARIVSEVPEANPLFASMKNIDRIEAPDEDCWEVHVWPPSVVLRIDEPLEATNPTAGARKYEAIGTLMPVFMPDHFHCGDGGLVGDGSSLLHEVAVTVHNTRRTRVTDGIIHLSQE
jgi:hypothetical protein